MEKFDRLAKRVGNFFEGFMEAAMAILGLCLICFIFVELWHLVELTPFLSGADIDRLDIRQLDQFLFVA